MYIAKNSNIWLPKWFIILMRYVCLYLHELAGNLKGRRLPVETYPNQSKYKQHAQIIQTSLYLIPFLRPLKSQHGGSPSSIIVHSQD